MEKNNFIIEPIKGQKTYTFSETIPGHPSRMLLVGPSAISGKSTALFNLLGKKFPYMKFYGKENIYIVCPSIKEDHRWELYNIPKENISHEFTAEFIDQLEEKVKKKKYPSLVIFDDCIPLPKKENKEKWWSLYTRSRHWGENKKNGGGLSVWAVTQGYKQIKPIVRSNCSNLCIWLNSQQQINNVYEEHSNGLHKKDWMQLYHYCTDKKHSFMHINYNNPDIKDGRFIINFSHILNFNGDVDTNLNNDTK